MKYTYYFRFTVPGQFFKCKHKHQVLFYSRYAEEWQHRSWTLREILKEMYTIPDTVIALQGIPL